MVQFCASRSNERLLENRPYNSISSSINTLQRLLHFVSIAQTILSNFVVVVIVVIVFVSSQYQQLCQYQFNLCAYREADIFVIQPSSQFCPISNNSHNTKSYGKKIVLNIKQNEQSKILLWTIFDIHVFVKFLHEHHLNIAQIVGSTKATGKKVIKKTAIK